MGLGLEELAGFGEVALGGLAAAAAVAPPFAAGPRLFAADAFGTAGLGAVFWGAAFTAVFTAVFPDGFVSAFGVGIAEVDLYGIPRSRLIDFGRPPRAIVRIFTMDPESATDVIILIQARFPVAINHLAKIQLMLDLCRELRGQKMGCSKRRMANKQSMSDFSAGKTVSG